MIHVTQEQKDTAIKILYIYTAIRKELEGIEEQLATLTAKKNSLVEKLEETRAAERELISNIKCENTDTEFSILNLLKIETQP